MSSIFLEVRDAGAYYIGKPSDDASGIFVAACPDFRFYFRRSWNFQLLCPDFRFFSIKKAQIRTGLVGVKGLTLSRNLGKDEIILSQKKWETDNNSEAIQNWHLSD